MKIMGLGAESRFQKDSFQVLCINLMKISIDWETELIFEVFKEAHPNFRVSFRQNLT